LSNYLRGSNPVTTFVAADPIRVDDGQSLLDERPRVVATFVAADLVRVHCGDFHQYSAATRTTILDPQPIVSIQLIVHFL
jgi:hypothetical protein